MELKIQREWLAKMAEQEANGIVSVGGLVTLAELTSKEHNVGATERSALSQLVQWQRRNLRLTMEALAKKADVDLDEVLMIETGHEAPEARTIFKIAGALQLPPNKLMTLAGLVKDRDPSLGNAALRFAACSAPVEALTPEETRALEEFVRALGD
jgi:HTH-type transcriptional regulator, competence development regulator